MSSACSSLNELLLVVNLLVELVVVSDQSGASERQSRLSERRVVALDLSLQLVPLLVESLALIGILLHGIGLLISDTQLERLLESDRIDFLQDSLESDEGLLQDLVPVMLRKINDDRHEHGERLLLVSLEDVQEVVVLKEAHSSVSNLQMNTANALDDTLEKAGDQSFDLINFANLEDFLKLRQKECLLDAVGKRPKLK